MPLLGSIMLGPFLRKRKSLWAWENPKEGKAEGQQGRPGQPAAGERPRRSLQDHGLEDPNCLRVTRQRWSYQGLL